MAQPKDKMSEVDEHIMRRFDIQKRLGKGAYGIVWKAVDRKTKDTVAVKKIFDAFRNQTDAQRTFREIVFLQSFKNHPNIVRLYSIHRTKLRLCGRNKRDTRTGSEKGSMYVIRAANNKDIYLGFEYMETDLHNVIRRGNILKDIHNRYIIYQLLKAIKYIHSGNVIHRDLKPSNVLLDCMCRCKLADFGLARSLTQVSDTSGSTTSDCDQILTDYVATRWYRAPEILIANRRYTKGIDLWSLGCILAEMEAGKPIFPGTSTVNQVEKIMATIPTPSKEDIDVVCVSGVGSCMIKNASSVTKIPLQSLIGSNTPKDALHLMSKLLLFNPFKRLTAEKALEEEYVAKFHDPGQEIILHSSVLVPLNDDIRLTVDDYRDNVYDLLATYNRPKTKQRAFTTPILQPRVMKSTEKYLRNYQQAKEKPICFSEPKICYQHSKSNMSASITANARSDSRVLHVRHGTTATEPTRICKAGGDYENKLYMKSTSDVNNREKLFTKKKTINNKNVIYNSFNSYNKTHGVITQSALMELRAAGMR